MCGNEDERMPSRPLDRAFRAMRVGFLFLLPLKYTMDGAQVHVLPDFLGWIFFLVGLRAAAVWGLSTRGLRTLALAGLVLSVPRAVAFTRPTWDTAYLILDVVALTVAVVFVWKLCGRLAGLARGAGEASVGNRALRLRWLYPLVGLPLLCSYLVGAPGGNLVAENRAALTGMLAAGILSLAIPCVVTLLMMRLMAMAARLARPAPTDGAAPVQARQA